MEKFLTVEVVGSAAVACVTWVRSVCRLLQRARRREIILSMGLVGSSAVACIACVRGGWNLLRWTRQREERLSMVVIGDGGGGGDGIGTDSSGPARKETCSGRESKATALSMPTPSQSKH
jgi:hypothetical protein